MTKEYTKETLEEAARGGKNLKGARLEGLNLEKANLAGAKLSGAFIYNMRLSGANFTDADLTGASFNSPIDLTQANLTGANLSRISLSNSVDLTGANLIEAIIVGIPSNLSPLLGAQTLENAVVIISANTELNEGLRQKGAITSIKYLADMLPPEKVKDSEKLRCKRFRLAAKEVLSHLPSPNFRGTITSLDVHSAEMDILNSAVEKFDKANPQIARSLGIKTAKATRSR